MITLLAACGSIGSGWAGAWWVCRHPEQFSRVGAGNGKRRAVDQVAKLRTTVAEQQAELQRQHDNHLKQLQGHKDALALGAKKYAQLEKEHAKLVVDAKAMAAILAETLDRGATPPVPALADVEESWAAVPDPAPRDPEQLPPIALSLPRPATYEPADPAAETQAVPQVEQTQVMPIAVVEEATAVDNTQVMPIVVPVVALDPVPRTTWGRKDEETAQIEAALSLPGPLPGAGASEISIATGLKAVTTVRAVVTEAAS